MKAQAHALASARVKMQQATAAAAVPGCDLATLEERLVDAQTKHASALADLRAGRLDEAVAGARMAAASADAADLEKMIAAARPKVTEAARVRASAAQAVQDAELALKRAEQEATLAALDRHIAHVEEKLCEAIAARFNLGVAHEGGAYSGFLSRHWRPSEPLRRAVAEGAVPASNPASVPAVPEALAQ
jgi:hypothetical protein